MKYVQAVVALGLFGWLSWSVYSGSFIDDDGGSSKSRALMSIVTSATDQFGTMQTAGGLAAFGLLLALFFVMRSDDA